MTILNVNRIDDAPMDDSGGTTPVLEARKLSAGYGQAPVIRDIDIVVSPGEVVAILGPNGAGKTTTLLALSGELPLLSGQVLMAGQVVKGPLHKRARRGLAFVPEERSVFRSLSCADNLRTGDSDSASALALFPELEKRLAIRGGLLSGGEQQMLGVGRAMSRKPKVLVVDELSLGLAPLTVRRLFRALRAAADDGLGVLIVEQHVRQALSIADRAHVMQRGRIVLSGRAVDLLDNIEELENRYLSGSVANVE